MTSAILAEIIGYFGSVFAKIFTVFFLAIENS